MSQAQTWPEDSETRANPETSSDSSQFSRETLVKGQAIDGSEHRWGNGIVKLGVRIRSGPIIGGGIIGRGLSQPGEQNNSTPIDLSE